MTTFLHTRAPPAHLRRSGGRGSWSLRAAVALVLACLALPQPLAAAARRLVFFPDWFPGPQFAGLYVALDRGYFRDAGLEVELRAFAFGQNAPASMDAAPEVAALGSSEGYIFVQKRAAGADLRALTAVLRESPAGFISLAERGIGSARDFAGQRIGVHAYAAPLFRWFIANAGLAPDATTMVSATNDLGLLERGEVDALQGFEIEECVEARRRFGAGRVRFVSFRELGFPGYSQVIYATRAQLDGHAPAFAAFVGALRRGWIEALAHPGDALASVAARMEPATNRELLRAMLAALPAYVAPGGERPLGALDLAKWRRVGSVCVAMGLVPRAEEPEKFCVTLPERKGADATGRQ